MGPNWGLIIIYAKWTGRRECLSIAQQHNFVTIRIRHCLLDNYKLGNFLFILKGTESYAVE